MNNKKIFIPLGLFLLLLSGMGGYFVHRYHQESLEEKKEKYLYEKRKTAWMALNQTIANEITQFKGESGIVIKDLESNWEISFNKEALFPAASLPKMPIMAACFLAAAEGKLKLNRSIALKSADKFSDSGILKHVEPGTVFSVKELIEFMIYASDNTATNILTRLLGLDYLNNCFKKFGLRNTTLSRKIADYRTRDSGIENYTTAGDMALILEKMYGRELINKDISEKCIDVLKLQKVRDRIPKYLPVDAVTAHKTGLERGVCHDVGIVFTKKGDFIICVLTKHANANSIPSKEFIAKIALHVYSYSVTN